MHYGIQFGKAFNRRFSNLKQNKKGIAERATEVILNLREGPPFPEQMNVKPLHGARGLYSARVGGDYRIHFRYVDEKTIKIVDIGTHSQLYG